MLFGGALYYLYNYISLGFALLSISFYCSYVSNHSFAAMIMTSNRWKHLPAFLRLLSSLIYILTLKSHYAFLGLSAWSILSTIEQVRYDLLACLFVPSIYLFLTEKITHPSTQWKERNPREGGRTERADADIQVEAIPWPQWPPRD